MFTKNLSISVLEDNIKRSLFPQEYYGKDIQQIYKIFIENIKQIDRCIKKGISLISSRSYIEFINKLIVDLSGIPSIKTIIFKQKTSQEIHEYRPLHNLYLFNSKKTYNSLEIPMIREL